MTKLGIALETPADQSIAERISSLRRGEDSDDEDDDEEEMKKMRAMQ